VELLRTVDGPERVRWLAEAMRDEDSTVSAAAILVSAAIEAESAEVCLELFESDFADADHDPEVRWEWEYVILLARDDRIPNSGVLVWTSCEDDREARRLALMRATVTGGAEAIVPVLVSKRFVNRYTRSPRSLTEAVQWRMSGRPRPPGI
jgi:hypothetical protein